MKETIVKDAVSAFASLNKGGEGKLTIDEKVTCACGNKVRLTDLTVINTGVFQAINTVCMGCVKGAIEDSKLARLVCSKCRTVIGRVKPSKDKTGFRLEAGKSYHLSGCDACCPGETEFKLLEKVLWDRKFLKH